MQQTIQQTNIITNLQDYMFTSNNLNRFNKHIIQININPKASSKNITYQDNIDETNNNNNDKNNNDNNNDNNNKKLTSETNKLTLETNKLIPEKKYETETFYKPKQKDSLFWCFYILKYGYSNYEMEINNQYFTVEKKEKFKYIEMLRKNKEILKIYKIKPFTELEDDLANKDKISVKTFFALCILENINILLVDKRKIFELTCIDIDDKHPVNIIHRNRKNYEHHIELNVTNAILNNYRETYYKSNTFDASIKSIGSYKLDELLELCKKLEINITANKEGKKKMTKKRYL